MWKYFWKIIKKIIYSLFIYFRKFENYKNSDVVKNRWNLCLHLPKTEYLFYTLYIFLFWNEISLREKSTQDTLILTSHFVICISLWKLLLLHYFKLSPFLSPIIRNRRVIDISYITHVTENKILLWEAILLCHSTKNFYLAYILSSFHVNFLSLIRSHSVEKISSSRQRIVFHGWRNIVVIYIVVY